MCGNRVEELETRVQELQASVEGLTDELVECKVRIRELENTVDEESGFSQSDSADSDTADVADTAGAEADETEPSTESEILVPEAGTSNTEAPEEADNTSEAESESETEEDTGSDIIVA